MKHGRRSVRFKMILLTFAAVFGTVALCLVLNETFLVKYYESSKQKELGKLYGEIDTLLTEEIASESGKEDDIPLSEELRLQLDILCAKSNITTVITKDVMTKNESPADIIKYVYGAGGKNNPDDKVIWELIGDYLLPGFSERLRDKKPEIEKENYSVFSLYDMRMKSKYIELVGKLENGDIILMRSNVESMQESVKVANKFLVYAGLASAIIISIIMYFVSRRFTKPVLQLADIAKEMSELNFDVKYQEKSKDEIGALGNSINVLSETLEKTISELKTANNELQTDLEKKTKAEEVRKEFLSNVTHELKTPIALIQGYAEGLKDNISESPEDREFYCDVIIDEASKMNTMVKKLLSLNHLEYGTTKAEFARFDLTEMIQGVLATTGILAKQKEITMHFEEKESVFVWADESMIEEVLTNYISNAFHHVNEAGIIEVRVIRKENRVRVAVFNTGEQIPEEDLSNIWIKFYKVDKARTREYGGNGIGLSIVKAIMEAHNQPYGVKNHAIGVEFWFELDSRAESQN